ncbi:hypothetical protein PIB30_073613 [Stylosanthes scabra]|uniref:CRC domain-containing protein n=1 Tax=Stylosanthes scabra TaxID=79078 RepID=A0ABU6RQ24_9FABA|nr:hypothetical protein [Stylosanthes scabra]
MASCESSGDMMNVGASDFDPNDGNKKRKQSCNCEKSQCLQLYCECFSSGNFCNDSCSCKTCMNNEENNVFTRRRKLNRGIHTRFDPRLFMPRTSQQGIEKVAVATSCKHVHGSNKEEQEQEEGVLSNNNNNNDSNNGMVNNGSSSQSHHPAANNDNFLPH